jgi:hypothetical protein
VRRRKFIALNKAANVRFWHKADMAAVLSDVCFWG